MEYLSTLDASFLEAEDADQHVSLAVGALAVLGGPMPEFAAFAVGLGERLAEVPRFRQVLHTHPLDLGAPAWVDDVAFDICHHVRRAAVPGPGDDKALFRLAADLMERRLDRDHPLWECWMIEGLDDGQWAILMKIHHCIADGIATTQLLSRLSDEGADDTFVNAIHPPTESPNDAHLPRITLNPLNWVSGMWRTSVTVSGVAARVLEGALEIGGALIRPAESSGLSGPVTGMRRYAAARVPLVDVAKVCEAYDVTINDVALAAITDSYRAALIRRGERPRARSLRTLVPVSVRSDDALDEVNNRVSLLLPYLPVEEPDPVQQLRAVHSRLTRAKQSGQRQAGSLVVSATNLVPFAVTAWAMRALMRLPQRAVVTVVTNVPGPRRRLQVMGQPVIRLLPILPIALQVRTGIAILSYADDLIFGITADYDAASDVEELATGIARAAARMTSLRSTRHPSSAVTKRALKDALFASDG
jgi:diacylglycerol O-acyltransferase